MACRGAAAGGPPGPVDPYTGRLDPALARLRARRLRAQGREAGTSSPHLRFTEAELGGRRAKACRRAAGRAGGLDALEASKRGLRAAELDAAHWGTVGGEALAGAAAGLMGVLLTRGQDVVLARGTTVEMVLDRDLEFTAAELDFSQAGAARRPIEGDGTAAGGGRNGSVLPGRRGGLGPRNP